MLHNSIAQLTQFRYTFLMRNLHSSNCTVVVTATLPTTTLNSLNRVCRVSPKTTIESLISPPLDCLAIESRITFPDSFGNPFFSGSRNYVTREA